ncbi:MAG TPA: 16S rRNA (cytosine(1402)-N(4))-methyltransferase RsmH [Solirubrobacteraceae bacterium]|nr:16S rRNA (cytosine(1402)-N(4))-methyltransferase RsmH [Solirubrobacteraceae bacterium]
MLATSAETVCAGERSRRRARGGERAAVARRARAAGSGRLQVGADRHVPVLLQELVCLLDPRPGEVAIDCTFGAGGHAQALGARLGKDGLLIAIDRDPAAQQRFEELSSSLPCATRFIRARFGAALDALAAEGLRAQIVYFDLGVSAAQLAHAQRGFAYSYDAPLDMRMDPEHGESAADLLAGCTERELTLLFRRYGEERSAKAIARAIVARRAQRPIERTQELVEVIAAALPAPVRFGGGHPAKRVFQALRIAVNDELGELERALPRAWELLAPGGRLAAISFHSLEDRAVKRFLGARARGCICPPQLPVCACGREPEAQLLARRAIVAGAAEASSNPRSASARLRAARKIAAPQSPAGNRSARASAGKDAKAESEAHEGNVR